MAPTVPLRAHLQKPMCTEDRDTFLGRTYPKGRVRQDRCARVRSLVLQGVAALIRSLHEIISKFWGQRRLEVNILGDIRAKPHFMERTVFPTSPQQKLLPPKPPYTGLGRSGCTQWKWWQCPLVGARSRRFVGRCIGRWRRSQAQQTPVNAAVVTHL